MAVNRIKYVNGKKVCVPVTSRQEYLDIRNSARQKEILAKARKGETFKNNKGEDISYKTKLEQFNYSCLPNEDGTLRGSKVPSNVVGMDIDWSPSLLPQSENVDIEAAKEEWLKRVPEMIMAKKDEIGLVLLERSATKGYHIAFIRRAELSQEENLKWASELLGVKYDEGAKDITRVFFTTTGEEGELMYLDDRIFTTPSLSCGHPLAFSYGPPTSSTFPVEGQGDSKVNAEAPQRESVTNTPSLRNGTGNGGGTSSSPRGGWEGASIAFDLCVKHAGLDPEKMDIWGEHNWHANLMAVLSTGLPKLMSKEQLMAVVAEKLPNYYQYQDCTNLINYFYDNYDSGKGYMSAALREINAKAQTVAPSPALPREGAANASMGKDEDSDIERLSDGYNPPEPPKKLCRIHQLITGNFDPRFKSMILLASIPEMSAHASHYRGPYINGKEIGPQDYVAVIGDSGKGKNNVTDLHSMMTEKTLKEHDKKEYEKCDANAEEREKKKNAKDCPPKYHPKLRLIETASSSSILDLQASLGENGMLLGHFSEADAFGIAGGTNTKLLSTLIRKGWSGEMHTQYYMSDCSRNVMARMCMSLLVCGTVNSVVGGMLSGKNTENGLMQRFIPVVVPKAKRTFRPPVCNRLNTEEKEELQQIMVGLYTQDLSLGDSTLTLEMPLTRKAIETWYDDLEERYNNGEVTEAEADLSTRVGEHMMRAAIPLVALEGRESKEMLGFIKWVGDVAYYNLCWIFGHSVQKNLDEAKEIMGSHQDLRKTAEPILQRLPDIFTLSDMKEMRKELGQSDNCHMLLKRYVEQGKLKRLERGVYQKTENYHNI